MFTFIATALLKGVEDLGLTASGCSIPERPRLADFDYCWCVRRRRSALRAVRTGPVHSTSMHPAFIGSFQILRELGRGGMGVVYLKVGSTGGDQGAAGGPRERPGSPRAVPARGEGTRLTHSPQCGRDLWVGICLGQLVLGPRVYRGRNPCEPARRWPDPRR